MNKCPVCGYDGLPRPAYNHSGRASFGICECCGTQFGYDDARRSHESLRREWIAKGTPWSGPAKPKPGWDPEQQLRSVENQPDLQAIARARPNSKGFAAGS